MAEPAMALATKTTRNGAGDDDALLARIAEDRDREAFADLFARHERAAFNLALHLTGRRALAEEAVQDAFLRVWTSAATFKPGNARAWLLRIVANQSLKKLRGKGRREEVMTGKSEAVLARAGAHDAAPAEGLEREETYAALRDGLAALPEANRQLIALYYGAGYTQNEIAEALAIPARTVSFKLDEALKRLRATLAQAGVAAAMPVLAAERLGEALATLHPPPSGLYEQLAARLADPGALASANAASRATRRAAAAKAGSAPLAAGVLLSVAALGAGAWYAVSGMQEAEPAAQTAPAEKTETEASPVKASAPDAKAEALPDVDKTWDFSQGPAEDIKVVHRSWEWKRYTPEIAGMAAPIEVPVGIKLPMAFPKRPLRIEIVGRFLDVRKTCNIGVHWATEDDIPPSHSWYRDATTSKRPTTVVYLYDDFLVKVFAGQVMAMRRYEKPYPADRILISLTNYLVEKMVVKNITMDEIPKELHDPMALVEKYKFQRDERTFPDRMNVPQATDQR